MKVTNLTGHDVPLWFYPRGDGPMMVQIPAGGSVEVTEEQAANIPSTGVFRVEPDAASGS